MKNKKIIISIVTLVILLIVGYSFLNSRKTDTSGTYYYLGTVNDIKIINEKKSKAEKVLKESEEILKDIHNKMSSQLKSTEVNDINRNSGKSPIEVSEDTFKVIKNAVKYASLTDGVFDPSIGVISSMWNIGSKDAKIPNETEIKTSLPLVNYKDIELDEKNKSVFLKKQGMKIDLGAIAKGYAADKIEELIEKEGIGSAIINLGGNVFVHGTKPDGKNYKVGIQAPYEDRAESIGYVEGSNISVVTSGVYERFIKDGDKILHHMLNPKTGYPFDNNLNSVSIISKVSMDGDALSTSTFGLGIEKSKKFIENNDDIEAIFITKDKKVILTDGLKDIFKLTDNSYTIVEQ